MKIKFTDILQIILAITITGSTAYAMQPSKVEPVAQTVSAPAKQEKPAEQPKPVVVAAEAPKAEAPPVKAPEAQKSVAPEIQKPDNYYKEFIYGRESGNCPTKWQGEYGSCPTYHGTPTNPNIGYGLCQSTPAWKMASAGADWATSYATQDRWCSQHAVQYGGWAKAYAFWQANRWW